MAKTRKEKPEYRDASSFAQSLSGKTLHCRELGHVWRHHTVAYDAKQGLYDRALRCASCGTLRRQTLNSRGHVLTNSYTYAPGYLSTNVLNRDGLVGRDVFRLEALTRWVETHATNTEKAG